MEEEAKPQELGDPRVPGITYLDDVRTSADQIVLRLTDEVDGEVADILETVQRLYQERAGLRKGPTWDNARRRLQNHRLRTPYLSHCIAVLRQKSLTLQKEFADGLAALVKPMIKLELVRAELDVAMALQSELDAEKAANANEELHPAIAEFAEHLYIHYGVSRWLLAAATPDQLFEICHAVPGGIVQSCARRPGCRVPDLGPGAGADQPRDAL